MPTELRTERLILRRWTDADRSAFAEMNADPEVMKYFFPGCLSREESDAMVDRIEEHFASPRLGFWAVEVPGIVPFAGLVRLAAPRFTAPFTPCVEIGWRIARAQWGHGYATEAAGAALAYGFGELDLQEIVALTVPANTRSRRVMEKLGMTRDPHDDFEHPFLPEAHPLRAHVLYRKARASGRQPAVDLRSGLDGRLR
jgi:RimJ/RimL family protein N-acetyltransferase